MAIDQAVFSLDSISKMSSLEHLMGSFDFSIGESDKSAGQGTVSKLAFEALRMRTVTSRVRIQVSPTGQNRRRNWNRKSERRGSVRTAAGRPATRGRGQTHNRLHRGGVRRAT